MESLGEIWRKLLFRARRRQFELDLEEEMRFHLDHKMESNRQDGMPATLAGLSARRQFGNITSLRETSREAWSWTWMEALVRDARYGARLFRRNPGFSAVAVATLALGLGVNTAIFMLLYNLMLRPLPYPDPDRLVKIYLTWYPNPGSVFSVHDIGFSYPKFQDFRAATRSFESIAAFGSAKMNLAGVDGTAAERVLGEFVSSNYFHTLGVSPALGRAFLPQEDAAPHVQPVAVIADTLWRRRWSASADILGQTMRVGPVSLQIVGVAPAGFFGESGRAEFWTPITMAPLLGKSERALTARNQHWFDVVGRLRPGVSRPAAAAEVRAAMDHLEEVQPSSPRRNQYGSGLMSLAESRLSPGPRKALLVFYAAVGLVLLIACGNLANLTMARMVGRRREVAMRLALGAGRASLTRQFLVENVLLSLAGGAAGILFAAWSARAMFYLRPESTYASWPGYLRQIDADALRLSLPVVAFSFALSLASGLLFGLAPALRASRADVGSVLKGDTPAGSQRLFRLGFRGALLAFQIALATVLLSGAGLLIHSFARIVNEPMEADPHNVLAFHLSIPSYKYDGKNERAFLDRLLDRLRQLPGVTAAAAADDLPALERDTVTDFQTVPPRPETFFIGRHDVDPEFFRLFRVPLRSGRFLTERDRTGPKVVLLSERVARTVFPGANPIGQHIFLGESYEIVGVTADVRYARQKQQVPIVGEIFVASGSNYIALRAERNAAGLIPAVRRAVAELDPEVPVWDLRPLEDQIADVNWQPRFTAVLLSFFAAMALGLAMVGIYGAFSYAVAARTREFGIRIASGAGAADILRLVGGEGLALSMAGLAVGVPAALVVTRVLGSMLYETASTDPATYIATSATLLATALGACLAPALRATRVDPIAALRCE